MYHYFYVEYEKIPRMRTTCCFLIVVRKENLTQSQIKEKGESIARMRIENSDFEIRDAKDGEVSDSAFFIKGVAELDSYAVKNIANFMSSR